MYTSRFEDDFGNVTEKELPRPTVAHFLYEFLPLIDEHNKSRQNVLGLERHWLTKDCWFRILTTLIGMSLVDLQRWDRNKRSGVSSTSMFLDDGDNDFGIKKMANLVAKPLRSGKFNFRRTPQPSQRNDGNSHLARIKDEDSNMNYSSGKPRNQSCFICRKYSVKTECTQWICRVCGMPVCKVSRGRDLTCLDEHLCSTNEYIGCGMLVRSAFRMPPDLLQYRKTKSMAAEAKRKRKSPSNQLTPPPPKRSNPTLERRRSQFTPPSC